jgi:hypothetical protein
LSWALQRKPILRLIAWVKISASQSERDIAIEQAGITESRRLAAESSSALIKYPQRSLLLAVEAVKVGQSLHGVRLAAAEQSLREALGFIEGRSIAISQSAITAPAISPDNRGLVSGSWDKIARLLEFECRLLSRYTQPEPDLRLRRPKDFSWNFSTYT